MRLQKIEIENFGIYKDHCIFYFPYDENKRVSLLIGQNGSGKTTFLNAIKTGLYGSMLFGAKKMNPKYSSFIANALNHDAKKLQDSRFAISITFISNFHKYDGVFTISRVWEYSIDHVSEKVALFKNDLRIEDEELNEFFSAFYHYYPLELFDMFYLDGEKIDHLSVLNSNIYNLVETSMNLDLFKHLRDDLESYAIKKLNNSVLNELENEKKELVTTSQQLTKQKNDTEHKLHKLREDQSSLEDQISDLVQKVSSVNINLPETIKNLSTKQDIQKKELSVLVGDTVPFLFLKKDIERLSQTLLLESIGDSDRIVREAMNEELVSYLVRKNKSLLKRDLISKIVMDIETKFSTNVSQLHRINSDDKNAVDAIIQKIMSIELSHIKSSLEDYLHSSERLKVLNEQSRNSNEMDTEVLLHQMLSYQKELTLVLSNISTYETDLLNLEKIDQTIKNRLHSIESDIWKALKASNVNAVVTEVDTILVQYMEAVKISKIEKIENFTLEMFCRLVHKDLFIKNITLDETNITLLNHTGNLLTVDHLSSGERQLLILSIIYAILNVSERSIPLIFDTLLGRLDKKHQQHVYECFIASCPDQVIILATDSELENIDLHTIESLTNTKYKIDFSKSQNKIEELR